MSSSRANRNSVHQLRSLRILPVWACTPSTSLPGIYHHCSLWGSAGIQNAKPQEKSNWKHTWAPKSKDRAEGKCLPRAPVQAPTVSFLNSRKCYQQEQWLGLKLSAIIIQVKVLLPSESSGSADKIKRNKRQVYQLNSFPHSTTNYSISSCLQSSHPSFLQQLDSCGQFLGKGSNWGTP